MSKFGNKIFGKRQEDTVAIANIYTSNGTVKIPVQCGITDIKTGEPTYLWETDLYRQNKLNE